MKDHDNSPLWMGLMCNGEEVIYPGYRRRRVVPISVSLSPDSKEIIIRVEADFRTALGNWGLVEEFFLSDVEEEGVPLYQDRLAYPIKEVPKGDNFTLNTTFTAPFSKMNRTQ